MPPDDGRRTDVAVRLARPEDIPASVRSFSESFTASVWARVGGGSAEAYLSHFVRDRRDFMIVADHAEHGIVGGCLGTMRMHAHRRGVLGGNLARLGFALLADVARDPQVGVTLGRRVGAGLFESVRRRLTGGSEPPAPVEHVEPGWPLEIAEPGYIAAYWVSPHARGHQAAARMSELAVAVFREQAFLWSEVHTYVDNIASQTTALRAGFRLVRKAGPHLVYRQYLGEGDPGDVEVRLIESPAEDAALAESWERLLASTPDGSGFHAWAWVAAHLAEIGSPRVGVVSLRGRPVAIMPLQLDAGGRLCFVTERRGNYCGPVYDPQHMSTVAAGFRELVSQCRPKLVDLKGLRERSPFLAAVRELVLGQLGAAASVNTIGCPEASLEGGWTTVWSRHKSKHRGNWRRAQQRLERLGTLTYEEHTETKPIVDALPAAVRLYEARWHGLNVDKAFGEGEAEFQRTAAAALARDGHVVMCVLALDGEMLAFSYSLRANGVSSSYTLAHDDRYAPYSPGQLLLIHVLQRAAERGDPVFDFSVGDEAYKDVWATGRQELFRLVWGAGARRRTAIDEVKAQLRAQPTLRRLKQEGLRGLLPTRSRAGAIAWHVQHIAGPPAKGVEVAPMRLAEMRSLLEDELFRLSIDRAFRGDELLLLRDAGAPVGFVWRAAPSRRVALTGGYAETEPELEVYVQPHPLRADLDWTRLLPALGPGLLVSRDPISPPVLASFDADPNLSESHART